MKNKTLGKLDSSVVILYSEAPDDDGTVRTRIRGTGFVFDGRYIVTSSVLGERDDALFATIFGVKTELSHIDTDTRRNLAVFGVSSSAAKRFTGFGIGLDDEISEDPDGNGHDEEYEGREIYGDESGGDVSEDSEEKDDKQPKPAFAHSANG